jgi:hypothetical protein
MIHKYLEYEEQYVDVLSRNHFVVQNTNLCYKLI